MSLTSKEQLDILEHRLEGLNSALQKEMGWAGQVRMREDIDMLMTVKIIRTHRDGIRNPTKD